MHVAVAIRSPRLALVRLLVDADSDALRTKTWTDRYLPIHVAVMRAPLDIVEFLVERDPDSLQATTRRGETPLYCVFEGRAPDKLGILTCLLRTWPDAARVKAQGGYLPLHRAARQNAAVELIQLVHQQYPAAVYEATAPDFYFLPIHLAAGYASADVVRYLAEQAPETAWHRDGNGYLPIHLAARSFNQDEAPKVVAYLAILFPDSAADKSPKEGWLPLHVAAHSTKAAALGVVQCLVRQHPEGLYDRTFDDGSHQAHMGKLPVELARLVGRKEVADYLEGAMRGGSGGRGTGAAAVAEAPKEA